MATPSAKTPHDILYGDETDVNTLFTIDTHPARNLVAAGDICGRICLYSYGCGEDCRVLRSFNHHGGGSCRVLRFSKSGNRLFSGSQKDGGLYVTDVETGRLLQCMEKAHSVALYSMYVISEGTLASGDDSGQIKVWDSRSWKSVLTLRKNKDFISSMLTDNHKRTLLATSGDGSLTVVDLRQRRLEEQSDCNESELLSLAIVKGGTKVVCGDGEGALMLYNWGLWGDITDRYPCQPHSIDSMIPISDTVICTGSMDGAIRSVQVLPNQILGTVGHHTKGLSVDTMCLTHDREFLVTNNEDSCKFWAAEDIPKLKRSRAAVEGERRSKKGKKKRKWRTGESGDDDENDTVDKDDFFADL